MLMHLQSEAKHSKAKQSKAKRFQCTLHASLPTDYAYNHSACSWEVQSVLTTTACQCSGVAAVAWAGAAGALYAAGADRQLVRLDAGNGAVLSSFEAGKFPLSALALTPDGGRAFAASTAVAAWDPAAQRRLFKFTGHPVSNASLACFVLSANSTETLPAAML